MDLKLRSRAVLFVFLGCASAVGVAVGQEAPATKKTDDTTNVRSLLEKWQASGGLPAGVVVHVGACLGAGPANTQPVEIRERWEFTSHQVRQFTRDVPSPAKGQKRETDTDLQNDDERIESRPFRSKEVCTWLLEGQAIEIQARNGRGPELAFVGSKYRLGTRSIRVTQNGEPILELYETIAATRWVYRKSDAIAFAKLYEQLTSRARELFSAKTDDGK